MKIGLWVQTIFIFLEVILFISSQVECFTIPISVSTGMAIIIALVKVKAVIVKVLFGLKAMGYESFVWRTNRRRRRRGVRNEMPVLLSTSMFLEQQDELMEAWNDLEQTVGKIIQFDLDSCLTASSTSSSSISRKKHEVDHHTNKSEIKNTRDQEYSTWVSKILGSLIKDPVACQILEEKLKSSSSLSSSGQNKNKTGIGTKR